MEPIDQEKERQRLARVYAGMEDGELDEVGGEWLTLTKIAREALRAEMMRRGMSVEEVDRLEREGPPEPALAPVVIRRFRDLPDAWVVQSMVDSAGIESVLLDENIVGLDWFWSNAVGGVKLQVRARDAGDAILLLNAERPREFEVPGFGVYQQPLCPQCGSMDVSCDGLNRRVTYGLLLFTGLPIPVKVRGWQCYSCRHRWKTERQENSE
jgi:hypothetical protein